MYSTTCVRQFEMMDPPNQFMPPAGLVINQKIGNCDFQLATAGRFLDRKTLCELFQHIGNNPKLIDELALRKNRTEKIDLLIHHKLISSPYDLPIQKELKQEVKHFAAASGKREETFEGAGTACSMIAFGGSYED